MELQAPEGPARMKSHRLLSTSKRLELVADQITELQGQLRMQAGIRVVMVASCGHSCCGAPRPADLPEEALVVELGCGHAVPLVEMPPDERGGRLRAERPKPTDAVGQGLSDARQKALLKTIRLLR